MTSVTIEYVYMNNKNEKIQIDASYNKEFATVIIYTNSRVGLAYDTKPSRSAKNYNWLR